MKQSMKTKLRLLLTEGPPTLPMTPLTALVLVIGLTLLEILLMLPVLELSDRLAAWPARASMVYVGGYLLFRLIIMLSVMAGDRHLPGRSAAGKEASGLWKSLGRWRWLPQAVLAMGIVAGFRILYDLTLGAWLLSLFPENEALLEAFEFLMQSPLAAGFYVLILAPVFEEFLFRGVLMRGILFKGFSPVYAVVVSSALFALVHLNMLQGIHAFLLGCLLGGIYLKTGSFSIVVLGHMVSNVIVWLQG
ncbi:CPBP family intramembrane glutamic endopeptidase [Acidaminobacter hydrogenoformans]|uniref:CPBP family intramembrane glutamic endopeptidase n=1 Tax=Acidaminobacter hydrogenoformans TaxID=65403 RepID=UPI00147AE849|nr:type II CAAX endopeptidase family protein [Acidaminobacter hydrogenoformans]